ncbi:MAG: diguanylate cyclase [Desulfuromonadaceae bacterium]|nr:diguanylate cyclase [Desulfuromonadaceae bacterium]
MRESKKIGAEIYHHLLEALPTAVFFTDAQANIRIWNEVAAQISGLAPADVEGKTLTEVGLSPEIHNITSDTQTRCGLLEYLFVSDGDESIAAKQTFSLRAKVGQGSIDFTCRKINSESGLLGVVGIATSGAEISNAYVMALENGEFGTEQDSEHQFSVLNAASLHDALKRDWHRYLRYQNIFSILSLEVDFYAHYEATFGEAAATTMMRQIVSNISSSLRRSDILGQISADRFIVLLSNADRKSALKVANMLLSKLRELVCFDLPFVTTASIGVVSVEDKQTLEKTLQRVDNALQRSIEMGRNQITFWG